MFEMVYGKISSLFSSVYKENVQKSMSSYMKLSTRELKINSSKNWNSYKTKHSWKRNSYKTKQKF